MRDFRGGRATSGGRCEGKYGGKLASLNVIHVGNKLADAIMLNFTKIQHTVTYLIDVFCFFQFSFPFLTEASALF